MELNKKYVDLVTPSMRRMWDGIRSIMDIKDLPGEIWKSADGSNGLYEISSFMRVRSTTKYIVNNLGELCNEIPPKILKQGVSCGGGYWEVRFTIGGKRINKRVHRLYTIAFLQKQSNKNIVNHKNLIKTDNIPLNLEFVTIAENTFHAKINGAIPCGEKVKHSKLKNEQVVDIFTSKDSLQTLANKHGVCTRTIAKIKSGKDWLSVTNKISK